MPPPGHWTHRRQSTRRERVRERSRQAVARRNNGVPRHHRYRVISTISNLIIVSSRTLEEARFDAHDLLRMRGERLYVVDSLYSHIMETVEPPLWNLFSRDEISEKVNWQKEGF
jgi:hypothetical protein